MSEPNFNAEQNRAIESFINKKSVFVSASAGTGKTTMITYAYIKLLEQKNISPSEIVAITFTNNATNEMFMRIRSLVRKRIFESEKEDDKKYWTNIYNKLGRESHISTIDAFARKFVKKYSYKLGLLPNINTIEDSKEANIKIIKTIIESIFKNNTKYESIYSAMKLYQQNKKDAFIGNIIKFIGNIKPSIGSFDNLEQQIGSLLKVDMSSIDETIFSFVNETVDSIYEYDNVKNAVRITDAKIIISKHKEHILTLEQIKQCYLPKTAESFEKLEKCLSSVKMLNAIHGGISAPFKEPVQKLKNVVLPNYCNIVFKLCYKDYVENLLGFLQEVYEKYEEQKTVSNSLTFNDLISKYIELLQDEEVSKEIRDSIKYIIVDETQDTNDLQYSLINHLLFGTSEINSELLSSSDKVAFIVGDRKQSIYRFRNANISSFLNLEQIFENGKKSESIYLNRNYRSDEHLINFFNDVFTSIFKNDEIEYSDGDELKYSKPISTTDSTNSTNSTSDRNSTNNTNTAGNGNIYNKTIQYLVLTDTKTNDDENTNDDNNACDDESNNADNKTLNNDKSNSKTKANDKANDEKTESNTNAAEKHQLEAHAVAYHIRKKLDADKSLSYDSFAILLPVFTNLHNYIEALTKYNIPFYISSGKGFFGRIEIAHIINFLKYLVLKENQLLPLILNKTFFDISESELYVINKELLENGFMLKSLFSKGDNEALKCFDNLQELQNKIISIRETIFDLFDYAHFENSTVLINSIISKTKYNAYLMTTSEAEFAYSNIEKFIEIAYKHEREQSGNNIYTFIESLNNLSNTDEKYASVPLLKVNAITIMTVHTSKGLEFDNVVLGALSSSRRSNFSRSEFAFIDEYAHIPIHTDDEVLELCEAGKDFDVKRQLSERCRLLYVALTRAKKSLMLIGEGNSSSYRALIESCYKSEGVSNLFVDNVVANILEHDYSINNSSNIKLEQEANMLVYSYDKRILEEPREEDPADKTKPRSKINNVKSDNIDNIEIAYKENYNSPKKIVKRASDSEDDDSENSKQHQIFLHNIKDLLDNKIAEHDEPEWYENNIFDNDNTSDDEYTIGVMDVGTIVHEILELFNHDEYNTDKQKYIDRLVEQAKNELKRYSNGMGFVGQVKIALNTYINNVHIQNVLNGSEEIYMREHSFEKRSADTDGNINIMRSKIDLVTYNKAEATYYIIDYKFASEKNCIYKDRYKSQMKAYKEALSSYAQAKNISENEDNKIEAELMYLLS